jgi:hypothetical protein
VHFIFKERPFETPAVFPGYLSFARFLALLEGADVLVSFIHFIPGVSAFAMHISVYPFPNVLSATHPVAGAMTTDGVIIPVSLILVSIRPLE